MGRSVDYLSRAIGIAYINYDTSAISCDHCGSTNVSALDEDEKDANEYGHDHSCNACSKTFEGIEPDAKFEWECFTDNIEEILKQRIPSIDILDRKHSRWDGRETRIFAENKLAEFGISEYCGLVSISVRVIEDDYSWKYEALAKRWIEKVWPGIQDAIAEAFPTSALRRIGGFSNGEGVYELVKKAS